MTNPTDTRGDGIREAVERVPTDLRGLVERLREVGASQQHIDTDFARSTLATGTIREAADALSRVEGLVGEAIGALQGVLGLLETAKMAAVFTKPLTGRVVVNVEKLKAVEKLEAELERLRQTIQALSTYREAEAHLGGSS